LRVDRLQYQFFPFVYIQYRISRTEIESYNFLRRLSAFWW